jgi:hypothetical protein
MKTQEYLIIGQNALTCIKDRVCAEFAAGVTNTAADEMLWIGLRVGSEQNARFLRTKDPRRATRPENTPRCWIFILSEDGTTGIDYALRGWDLHEGSVCFHLQVGRVLSGKRSSRELPS